MAKKIRLDFSKTEERSGWNSRHMPEGVHGFKIAGVDVTEAGDSTPMLVYALVPTDPRFKTRRFPFYCKLQQNQLWKLRDLLVAAGISVPKKALSIDPEAPVGKTVAGEVVDATGQYEGRSEVNGIYPIDVLEDGGVTADDEDDEDEYDEADEEFEDSEEDEIEDDEEGEDDEELREEIEGLTLPVLRKRAKGLGIDTDGVSKKDLVELVIEEELGGDDEDEDDEDLDDEELEDEDLEDEDFEDEDEDDEEEEPEPAPRRRATPAKKAAPARKPTAKAAPAATPSRRIKRR